MSRTRDPFALTNVLVLSALAAGAAAVWLFLGESGWSYYTTPLRIRGYALQHPALKPSGTLAHALGLVGLAMMTVPIIYAARKQWSRLAHAGALSTWLEVHIFCGIVGPVLVTFHTAFKFNGLISVAYWSMVLVVASGFVGRYWYVRIPKTIRGVELTRNEIEERAAYLTQHVADAGLSTDLLTRLTGREVGGRWARLRLRRALVRSGVAELATRDLINTLAERQVLLRRLAYLERTRRLFAAWHLFHQPLVYLMFGISILHIGVALYFGYSFY